MEYSMVIKVKYEDTLRRFNARVVDDELDLNMDGLREKIVTLFKFAPDTQLNFTYDDEDNDVVALVDDDDLRDVLRQALNPLRITVSSSTAKSRNPSTYSTGSSDPSFSPPLQETIQNLSYNVSEILKALPEQLREPLSKLSSDLAKKASVDGASNLNEITSSLAKIGLQYLNQLSVVPPSGDSKKSVEAHKYSVGLENLVVPAEVTSGNTNTSSPVHPVFPNDSLATPRKQAARLPKKTGETSGVKYFAGNPLAAPGGIFTGNGTSSGISDYNWSTFAEDMGIGNSASGFQFTPFHNRRR